MGAFFGISFLGLLALCAVALGMWGCPTYNVYSAKLSGEAELARADGNRKIAVLEAQAKYESAKSLAAAEVERAKGVAQANQIIGDSLKGNEDYLRYLWIDSMHNTQNQVVYVPTEAGLPVLESTRNLAPKPTK